MLSKAIGWCSFFLIAGLINFSQANDIAQWLPSKVVVYLEIDNVGEFVNEMSKDEVVESESFQNVVDRFGIVLNQDREAGDLIQIEAIQSELIDELRNLGSDYQNATAVLALYLKNGKPTLLAAVKSPEAVSKTSLHVRRWIALANSLGLKLDGEEEVTKRLDKLSDQPDLIQRIPLAGSSPYIREIFAVECEDWCIFSTDRWLAEEVLGNSQKRNKRVLFESRKFKQHVATIRANVDKSYGRMSLFLNTNYLATGLIGAGVSPKNVRAFGIDRITGASASFYFDRHRDHNIFLGLDAKINIASPREGLFLALDDGGKVEHFPFELLPDVYAFQALDFDWKSIAKDVATTYDEIYEEGSFDELVSQMTEIEMAGVDFHNDFLAALGGTTGSAYSLAKHDNSMQLTGFTEYKSHDDAMAYATKAYMVEDPNEKRASFISNEIAANIHLICHDDETVARRFLHAEKTGLTISQEDFRNLSTAHVVFENWIFTGEKKSLEESVRKNLAQQSSAESTILLQALQLCRDRTKHDGPFFFERVVTFSYWQKFIQHLEFVVGDIKASEAGNVPSRSKSPNYSKSRSKVESKKLLNLIEFQLAAYKFFQSNYGQHVVLASNTKAGIRITGILFDGNVWGR